jgi:hypothetical protein
MENPSLTQHAKELRDSLEYIAIIAHPEGHYTVTILRWGPEKSKAHLNNLPFDAPDGPGPYIKFHPWNAWLGEQLMYCATKSYLHLVKEETDELIRIANLGAMTPALVKTAARAAFDS